MACFQIFVSNVVMGIFWTQEGRCIPCQSFSLLSCTSYLSGFYLKSDKPCGACEDNRCSSCCGAGQNQCLACNQGFTLAGSACIPCDVANCTTCEASQKCSACKNGYYLDSQNNKCKYCGDGSATGVGAIVLSQCGGKTSEISPLSFSSSL